LIIIFENIVLKELIVVDCYCLIDDATTTQVSPKSPNLGVCYNFCWFFDFLVCSTSYR
jgi:hypothetical protein